MPVVPTERTPKPMHSPYPGADVLTMLWDASLPGADGTEVAEALRPADHLIFHAQALFAIVIDKDAGGATARYAGSMYRSQRSTGSNTCPSASMTR
jgi:hypothetical protein